jgi:hypothetical protein
MAIKLMVIALLIALLVFAGAITLKYFFDRD